MTSPTTILERAAGVVGLEQQINTIIREAIDNQPRSLQKRIGPSELGKCPRWILHKLVGHEEPKRPTVAWKPAIGSAVHAYLEEIFESENRKHGTPWWVTEHRVTVGYLPDRTPITGSADLFHVPTGTVVDYKIVGQRQLANYRANGPSEQYRVQAHCYGGGFMLDPHPWGPPQNVAIYFLPRDREFHEGYFWTEPWDPQIWGNAVNRLNDLWRAATQLGMPAAAEGIPLCEDRFCHWCRDIERQNAEGGRTVSLFSDHTPL